MLAALFARCWWALRGRRSQARTTSSMRENREISWSPAGWLMMPKEGERGARRGHPRLLHPARSELGEAVISPLLSHVFLHYVFDRWADQSRRRNACGDVVLVRFADDFLAGFQHREDAERFLHGHYNHYAVPDNSEAIRAFRRRVIHHADASPLTSSAMSTPSRCPEKAYRSSSSKAARACGSRDHLRVPTRNRQHRDRPHRARAASTDDPRQPRPPAQLLSQASRVGRPTSPSTTHACGAMPQAGQGHAASAAAGERARPLVAGCGLR